MTYLPELDGALSGQSSKTAVLITSTLIIPQSTASNRRRVILINRDATNPIYFNFGMGTVEATTTNASLQPGESISLNLRCAIYGIATGGTVNLEWITEEDV